MVPVNWFKKNFKKMEKTALLPGRSELYEESRVNVLKACGLPRKSRWLQVDLGELYNELVFLSYPYLVLSSIRVEKGDGEIGWLEMKKGLIYLILSAKVRHSFLQVDKVYDSPDNIFSSSIFSANEALGLCHLLAVGEVEIAMKYGRFLLKNYYSGNFGSDLFFYSNHFYPFALKLFAIWCGVEMPIKESVVNPFGDYAVGVAACESEKNAKIKLMEMCEIHCKGTLENSDMGDFIAHPYNIFPVEILTILRIREKRGFSTDWPEHPLLDSKLSKPIFIGEPIEDEIVMAVNEKLARDCPISELNWI